MSACLDSGCNTNFNNFTPTILPDHSNDLDCSVLYRNSANISL